jgi:V/A-type H+-transporting ATPase subunit D
MPRIAVPVTKNNLLRLRGDLIFLRAGRDLLDQKREFLSDALLTFEREARALRADVEGKLAGAYDLLAEAYAVHGEAGLARLALGAQPLALVDVRERSLMGVIVPVVNRGAESGEPLQPPAPLRASAGASGLAADAVAIALRGLVPAILELAEIETSCLRLARELRAVQRKLNALEVVHIPAHRDTIRFIADQLEEREREQLFQLKRIRSLEERST